jgi:hypothetical protein
MSAEAIRAIVADAKEFRPPPPLNGHDDGAGPDSTAAGFGSALPVELDLRALPQSDPEPPAFIIPEWFQQGEVALLGGHGGTGKSMLAGDAWRGPQQCDPPCSAMLRLLPRVAGCAHDSERSHRKLSPVHRSFNRPVVASCVASRVVTAPGAQRTNP